MKKRIKVLRIIARLNIGGPAIHTILLSHYLAADLDTKLVVGEVSAGEESMDYLLEQQHVEPVYINTLQRELSFTGDIRSVVAVYRIIREFKPDIIHTHTAKAGTIGRTAGVLYNLLHFRSKRNRIRLIHTFHGHVFNGYFNRVMTFLFLTIERTLAVFTDRIIAVSDTLKKELVDRYKVAPDKKVKVIYNGYELAPFLETSAQGHRAGIGAATGSDKTVITTVGRLVPVKGHRFLIEAMARLRVPVQLVIVGDGLLRSELTDMCSRLGLSDRVEFAGYRREVIPIYEKTDIFVLASLNEGAPVAVVEALACARPVIATDVGGVRDLLGKKIRQVSGNAYVCERGILVPPADDESMAHAIEYLVNNREISYHMGIQGREFVKTVFSVDRLIQDMKMLYTEVLEQ